MNSLIILFLLATPSGFFGAGPSSASDEGMSMEKGIFSLEYNPAGLAWVDSMEIGVSAQGLFAYNLVGIAYRYLDWPIGVSVHHAPDTTGFSIGSGYLGEPLGLGGALTVAFNQRGENNEQNIDLRFGLQWRNYIGFSIGPHMWIGQDTVHFSGLTQVGAEIPVIDQLSILAGGAFGLGPVSYRVGGGIAFKPFDFLKIQSLVSTQEWGAAVILDNLTDRLGVWMRKEFPPEGQSTPWLFGLSYTRNIRPESVREVVVYKALPPRIDTVFIAKQVEATPVENGGTPVVSAEILQKQDKLMAKANRYYAGDKYEQAIEVWNQVVALAPSTDLAKLAQKNIRDVTALLETMQKIRSGGE
jgi:hypothetical protein